MSKGKITMINTTKKSLYENFDKENRSPLVEMDTKATSSLAQVSPNRDLTKVRQKKTTARVAPLHIPKSISSSSLLNQAAEEFHLPPHITALPGTDLTTILSSLTLTPPPFYPFCLPSFSQQQQNHQKDGVTAVVEPPGFISLRLRHGVVLDISVNQAIRLHNYVKDSTITLSACTTQMAMVHPKGRVLQYGPRVEVQSEDDVSVKNAKIFPRGISFTANNMALVYLLDEAGARSTSDMFHDLHATHIADMMFMESCDKEGESITTSIEQLDTAKYWRTEAGVDCWIIGQIFIQQTEDGLVTIQRDVHGFTFIIKTSPSNGKVRFDSRFLAVTASLGLEAHMFLRCGDRRLHYCGETKVFTVRNAGHSAGFDEEGSLRIF